MPLKKLSDEIYVFEGGGSIDKPVEGKANVPWKPGMKLTAINPRSLKSDGESYRTLWDGFVWRDGDKNRFNCPLGCKVFSYSYLSSTVFKCSPDIVFYGVSFWGGADNAKPSFFCVPEDEIWLKPGKNCTNRGVMSLSLDKVTHVHKLGKLEGLSKSYGSDYEVEVSNMTPQDFEDVGYRVVLNTPCKIHKNILIKRPLGFPFKFAVEALGIQVKGVDASYEDAFAAGEVVVTDSAKAALHTPWMANVKDGTTLTARTWGSDQWACVPLGELHPKFFTRKNHYLAGDKMALHPQEIPVDFSFHPVSGIWNGEKIIIAKDDTGLFPIRKLRQYDTSGISGAKLWRYGKSTPDSNITYLLETEVSKLKKVNRREEKAELESLRACYPWATKENLLNTSKELYGEDLFLKARTNEEWTDTRHIYHGWESIVCGCLESYFIDDLDVFIKGISGTLFKMPSYDKIKTNKEAWKALAAALSEEVPLLANFLSDSENPLEANVSPSEVSA